MLKDLPAPIGAGRMPAIGREQWTETVRELFAFAEGEEGRTKGSKYNFTHWFANHPELALNWMHFNRTLSRGLLDPRLRELLILRVAWRYDSEYEWHQHAFIAAPLGIGPDELAAVRQGPDAALWTPVEATCLKAADQLCVTHDIDDETWSALAAEFDAPRLMELLFLVGSYTLLAWVFRAVRMPLEGPEGSIVRD